MHGNMIVMAVPAVILKFPSVRVAQVLRTSTGDQEARPIV